MRLTVLGSGSAFSGCGHNSAYCVDGRILVDCGCAVQVQMPRAGLAVGEVTTVLLTHFHADHTYMLPVFLGARALEVRSPTPLRLAGPHGIEEYVRRLVRTGYGAGLHALIEENLRPATVVLQDGSDVTVDGYRIRAHAVVHSTGPSLAYAVTAPDGVTVGFSGDSEICAGLRRCVAATDVMVCECTSFDGPLASHIWAGEVSELVESFPRTRFVLSHLSDRRPLEGALVAHDLLTLEIPPPG
ncbi:MAG: ribonuclease Z [Chloroflexi bacterium]|nr:MAG: ribonuclease Z [Chloroflexota bacterium]